MKAKEIRNGLLNEMGISVRRKNEGANWDKCNVSFDVTPGKNGTSAFFVTFQTKRKPDIVKALTEVKSAARKLGVPMRRMRKYNSNRTDAPRIKYDYKRYAIDKKGPKVWHLDLQISYL